MRTGFRCRVLAAAIALGAGAAAPAADVVVRGNFAYGGGVSLLQPCGSDKGLWVDDFGPGGRELVRRYGAQTKRAYEEVYVEIKGWTRSRKPEDGIPEEYAAIFSPVAVIEMRPKASGGC